MIRQSHLKLIQKIAWSFAMTTAIAQEELYAEAALAFCESLKTFDRSKNIKQTTWSWINMRSRLIDYIRRESNHNYINLNDGCPFTAFETVTPDYEFYTEVQPLELLTSVSENCKETIRVTNGMEDILIKLKPKKARGEIVKALRNKSWTWTRIWTALRELKQAVNEHKLDRIII